ncbi:REI1 [Candida theae]|uniref:REI1 n=1 Tax=Candida theae TaxID=1198502 RepID=A0AAD5FXP7_9ASCO|nr:REI1 [Candida theae]KAI5954810.1 REI1 [Candida theae]
MFTCNTCNLQFPESNDQRVHMKSDWHRYNLKRKVAQLPPLTEELFNTKVASMQSQKDTKERTETKKEQRRKEKEALLQQKRAILEQARKAMLAEQEAKGEVQDGSVVVSSSSAEHLAEEKLQPQDHNVDEEPELTPEQAEEKEFQKKLSNKVEIPPTTCLFCHPKLKQDFTTIDENTEHMFKNHGLYIPEASYLVDKKGLIEYLAEKIGFGFCIACNYQGRNTEAAREHMQTKRHMRIPYETEDEKLEISNFYDFSSTYDDDVDVVVKEGEAGDEEDGEWEDVSGDEEGGDAESIDDDEELPSSERDAIYQDGNELILPSGAVVGHRSNARYYRQNLAPERILSEGQGTVIAAETRHMLTLQDRKELASKKRTWRNEKKREDVNDRRAAKFINNQPHYRDQLLQ